MPQRRQLGCRDEPGGLPVLERAPKRRTVSAARFAVFFTVTAWIVFVVDQIRLLVDRGLSPRHVAEAAFFLLLITSLTAASLAYLVARLGHLYRARDHQRVPRAIIDDHFDDGAPSLTVLVPSYREDRRVVRQTLLTAALQEYPDLELVLLIDDPPVPGDDDQRVLLEQARALPAEIESLLEPQRVRHETRLAEYHAASQDESTASDSAMLDLSEAYLDAHRWVEARRVEFLNDPDGDHSDQFVAIEVLGRLAADFEATATALREVAAEHGATLSRHRMLQLHRRLVWIFGARLTSFERKSFASLSHEANKAMNLNSYLGLMGGRFRIETSPAGRVLIPVHDPTEGGDPGRIDLEVRDPDYVLTLDADSTLLPEYCLRLVHVMETPGNERMGVVQTPYSSYQGAATRIERIAGATTDVQHLVHQGLTHYGATFWVGANAVLRKRAIDDLLVVTHERGFPVARYIADRTVIEDTESSIDLRRLGWSLHNHPERLSYSATPPDFGSLVVQRKRWANGGLVILPKMLRFVRRRGAAGGDAVPPPGALEVFLRVNYLASIFWTSLGLLILLAFPFDQRLISVFAIPTAVPYFVAMSSDLKRIGYRWTDIVRLYGFNLLLLPVNLAGSIQSVGQAIGGQKLDFARTPKVRGRTVAQLAFVITPLLVFGWSALTLLRDLEEANTLRAVFAFTNALLVAYAFAAFIGVRAALVDVVVGLREKVLVPEPAQTDESDLPHWASVLYLGSSVPEDLSRSAPLAVGLAAADHGRSQPAAPSSNGAVTNGDGPGAGSARRSWLDQLEAEVDSAEFDVHVLRDATADITIESVVPSITGSIRRPDERDGDQTEQLDRPDRLDEVLERILDRGSS